MEIQTNGAKHSIFIVIDQALSLGFLALLPVPLRAVANMLLPVPLLAASCAIAGVVSHKTYWSRHEFDAQVPRIVLGAVLTHFVLTSFFFRESNFLVSSLYANLLELSYIVALFASIAVYRLFCHPLQRFNGPYWARLTTWWKVKHIAKEGPHYALFDKLHRQYGDVVRTGPNNISINSVEALQIIYGSSSTCTKPPSYMIGGLVSVQSERDPHRHRLRRAVWDKALGTSASNAFFPRIIEMTELLVQRLIEQESREVSVNDWMHFITFDTMSTFIFSRSWNQLQTGTMHPGIAYASAYLKFAVFGTQVPWLAVALTKIPYMPEPQTAMMEFANKCLDARMEETPSVPDAMTYILSEKDPQAQQFLSRHDIESDVFMIQLAGADTSFSVLINLCFRLARNRDYQTQLRDEVKSAFTLDESGTATSVDWPRLSNCQFLTAFINETLRLHPPVPSGMPRVAPPEGLNIPLESKSFSESPIDRDMLHVPGNAVVSVPTYTLQRSPKYWIDPDSFIPERWTSQPELILDRRAWCPFSLGAYGCAGKYFALMEIKLIIARLVIAFDIQLPVTMGKTELDGWLDKQDDWMTLQPAELRLKFVKRET